MKILLLGASSYVGARLFFDLRGSYDVTGTYHSNPLLPEFIALDITDADATRKLIVDQKPDVIIHTANNASVKWCEANPEQAKLLNVTSTQTIVDAANEIGARLIYISSFAAINPSEVYGRSKRTSEEITSKVTASWIVIRPSLIVGYSPNTVNDRFFNRILANIDEGTEAAYDAAWKSQLTWLGHISEAIDVALSKGITNQVIPVASNEMKSRYDFVKDILSPLNITVTPLDGGPTNPEAAEDLSLLSQLRIPTHSYSEIVEKISDELRNRDMFAL